MRKLDIFIVRFLPIVLYIITTIVIIQCWNGVDSMPINKLHSNSLFYSSSLFLISLSNKRYHCVWNRAMYIELMFVPTFNYVDAKWDIIPDNYTFLMILTLSLVLTLIITLILAIRHFLKPRIKKMRYGKGQD